MSIDKPSALPEAGSNELSLAALLHGADLSTSLDLMAGRRANAGETAPDSQTVAFEKTDKEGPGENAVARQDKDAPQVCAVSPLRQALIASAALRMYDVDKLGDIPTLLTRNNCGKTTADVMDDVTSELQTDTGDNYNSVLDPRQTKQLLDQFDESPTMGTGVYLWTTQSKTTAGATTVISNIVPKSPAARAHLKRNDYIVGVDGVDTSKMESWQLGPLLCRNKSRNVTLDLISEGSIVEKTLKCEPIRFPSVDEPVDKGGRIFYIRIREFDTGTASELQQAMAKVPNASGFIIDLRDNGGGKKDEGIQTSELFIDDGIIMKSRDRVESDYTDPKFSDSIYLLKPDGLHVQTVVEPGIEQPEKILPRYPNLLQGKRLVVLQNGGTTSSAEVLLGALRDTAHAPSVGAPSHGKGIIQWLIPVPQLMYGRRIGGVLAQGTRLMEKFFPDIDPASYGSFGSMLRVTSGRYYTPSGYWPGDAAANRHPIEPDFPVAQSSNVMLDSPEDLQLLKAVALAKEELQKKSQPKM